MSQGEDRDFVVGDSVVYPSHGVGEITNIEEKSYAGTKAVCYVIAFGTKDGGSDYNLKTLTLRIPKSQAVKSGMRKLTSQSGFESAFKVLERGKVKSSKGMWNKRVKEYEEKINSGNVVSISEVLKELSAADKSYSEKAIFDEALNRLAREYSAIYEIEIQQAKNDINERLGDEELP